MANKTIGSVMIREIIRMKQKGFYNSKIAQSLGKSSTTILKHLRIIEVSGIQTEVLPMFKTTFFIS
jgi:predicted transcriptional regulator